MHKKLCLLASTLVLSGVLSVCVLAQPSDWARNAVDAMTSVGVSEPALSADYQENMSRAEFTAVLVNLYELAAQDRSEVPDGPFADIALSPYAKKIDKATSRGLISGLSYYEFGPDMPLTREQAARIIHNFCENHVPNINAAAPAPFADAGRISEWAAPSVSFCVANGLMVGTSADTFDPKGFLTREQGVMLANNLALKANALTMNKAGFTNYRTNDDAVVYNGRMFMLTRGNGSRSLVSVNLATQRQTALLDGPVLSFAFADGCLYALLDNSGKGQAVVRLNADTGEKTELANVHSTGNIVIDGDYLYVCDNNLILKMRKDGAFRSAISTENAVLTGELFVTDGSIYYGKTDGVARLAIDGAASRQLTGVPGYKLTALGNTLYTLVPVPSGKNEYAAFNLLATDLTTFHQTLVLEGIYEVYTTPGGVYAYKGEPKETNAMYKLEGAAPRKVQDDAMNLLTLNNAAALCFTPDDKLFFSVFKPVALNGTLDFQQYEYQYTNVIDLSARTVKSASGGPAIIHFYEELPFVYNKCDYEIYQNAEPVEVNTISEIERVYNQLIIPGMSEAERERAIHDYIVKNTRYASDSPYYSFGGMSFTYYGNNFNPTYTELYFPSIYTGYGTLVDGYAVCQGYAHVMKALCGMAGLESYYVTGTVKTDSGEGPHGWNIVKVDGNYYHVDVTWNDPVYVDESGRALMPGEVADRGGTGVIYKYFNLTDSQISKDHTMDNPEAFPRCTTTWSGQDEE